MTCRAEPHKTNIRPIFEAYAVPWVHNLEALVIVTPVYEAA